MKVLHLSYHEKTGGAAIAANRIHNSLLKHGVDSMMLVKNKTSKSEKVIISENIFENFFDKLNLFFQRRFDRFNSNINEHKISKSYNLLPTFKTSLIKKINPDVVNLHWIGNNFISFREISKINKPIIWTLHDMWPYCGSEHYSFENRYIDGYTKSNSRKNKKFLSLDFDRIVWSKKKKYLNEKINFISTSTWQDKNLKKSFLFKNNLRKKIFYPIDYEKWSRKDKILSREKLNLPLDKKILLFISERIDNPIKGFDIIKKILKDEDFKDCYLVVLGTKNKEKFENLKINFKFCEKVEDDFNYLLSIFSSADLLLAPSKLESFGIVAQEAAGCNLPVVAFSKTGFEDTISHMRSGYLAKNNDIEDFKYGVKWCLDSHNYDTIFSSSRDIVKNKFNEDFIAKEYINFYEEIING